MVFEDGIFGYNDVNCEVEYHILCKRACPVIIIEDGNEILQTEIILLVVVLLLSCVVLSYVWYSSSSRRRNLLLPCFKQSKPSSTWKKTKQVGPMQNKLSALKTALETRDVQTGRETMEVPTGRETMFTFRVQSELSQYTVMEGTVDGSSLYTSINDDKVVSNHRPPRYRVGRS